MTAIPDPRELLNNLADELRTQHYTYVADATSDFVLGPAELVNVCDLYGNSYLDMSAGDGVMVVGHRNPPVIAAINEHVRHHMHTARSGEHVSTKVSEYAQAISETFPAVDGVPQQVLFCASPEEAMVQAVSLAKMVSDVAGSIASLELLDAVMAPMERARAQHYVERYQHHNVCVIVDERRTGFGRTGTMWAHESYDIVPDITVLGGAGGGGFPFGAVVAGRKLFDRYGVTRRLFGASPVVCSAGLATLEQITPALLEHVKDCDVAFTGAMAELCSQFPDLVSGWQGVGLALAVVFKTDLVATRLFPEMIRQGLLLRPPVGRVITLTPPLVILESEVRQCVDLMASACLDWSEPL